jgi:hypothetical protein
MANVNNTTEWWSLTDPDTNEEISLNQYGWSIKSFGGSRYALPSRRGENQVIAYAPGQIHHEKYADSRTISLEMWVVGTLPSGEFTGDQVLALNDSFNKLRKLLWRPNSEQIILTRRWRLTNPVTGDPEVQVSQALAELTGDVAPEATGRTRVELSIDLLLADPYFYLPEITVEIPFDTPTVVFNPGDDNVQYKNFVIEFHEPESGPALTNPRLTNSTTDPDTWFRFERPIPDVPRNILTETVTFDIERYSISPNYIPLSTIVHSGSRRWFKLVPGNNIITLTGDGTGTGSATITFRPPVV